MYNHDVMIMAGECQLCSVEAPDELACKLCNSLQHYECAFGTPVNNAGMRGLLKKNFTCPVCVVSLRNDLVLRAVSTNQHHIRNNTSNTISSIADSSSEGRVGPEDLAEVQSIVVEEVNNVDHNAHPPGSDNFLLGMLGTPPRGQDNFLKGVLGTPKSPRPAHPQVRSVSLGTERSEAAKLHPSDISRAGRLSYILKTFKNFPDKRSTVLIGDSNTHGIDGRELDPDGSIAVRSFSGLCIVSCAYALERHKFSYPKIRKVIFSLGVNDILHSDQHCIDDWPIHAQKLQAEASRVFPRAKLCLIHPFHGLPKVSPDQCKDLEGKTKSFMPKFKRYQAPSMKGKVKVDGVHLNDEGMEVYMKFLQKNFTTVKPNSKSDTPPPTRDSGKDRSSGESFRVMKGEFPPLQPTPQYTNTHHPPPQVPPVFFGQQRSFLDPHSQVLREISNMATYMLGLRGFSPQQPHMGGFNPQQPHMGIKL